MWRTSSRSFRRNCATDVVLDAFMAGVRLVESGRLEGDYQAVNRKPRPGGLSLAFGAYQMLFYDPEVYDEPQGFIP